MLPLCRACRDWLADKQAVICERNCGAQVPIRLDLATSEIADTTANAPSSLYVRLLLASLRILKVLRIVCQNQIVWLL